MYINLNKELYTNVPLRRAYSLRRRKENVVFLDSFPNSVILNNMLVIMNKAEILEQIFLLDWPSEIKLAEYVVNRHEFDSDDGYYGVTYPNDLDEYEIEVEGSFISKGSVEINYWDGDNQVIQLLESEYVIALKNHLKKCNNIDVINTLAV
jgi:hypothetical protein